MNNLQNKQGRPKVHNFEAMQPGDVRFYPLVDTTLHKLQNNLITVANRVGKFRSKRVSVNGQQGINVWRVE